MERMTPERLQQLRNTFVRSVQKLEAESGKTLMMPGGWDKHGNWQPSLLTRFMRRLRAL